MTSILNLATYAGEIFIVTCGLIVAVAALVFLGGSARWILTAWFERLRELLGITYDDDYKGGD